MPYLALVRLARRGSLRASFFKSSSVTTCWVSPGFVSGACARIGALHNVAKAACAAISAHLLRSPPILMPPPASFMVKFLN
jgi:hypothetical protein